MAHKAISRLVRQHVRNRAHARCAYCQHPDRQACAPFVCAHVLPRGRGAGKTLPELAWACPAGNSHKYAKTQARDPQTGRVVPLFNPRHQRWARHFAWSEDCMVIIGRTAIGRATVETLHLNRPELLNLRHALYAIGLHPPEPA